MDQSMDDVRDEIREHGDEIRQELSERAQELRTSVDTYVQAKPLQAVGIAFGVGYLLSGALVSRTTARLAQVGLRFAFGGALKQAIATVGPELLMQAIQPRRGGGEAAGDDSETTTSTRRTRSSHSRTR